MHPKSLLKTLLAGQVALAAVIPIERDAREINPVNGLPAPGSNLNPISGLPTPHGRKHKHKHSHVRLGHNGRNPLSGLPVHAREAEPEAEAEPVRIVTHMHTSTSVVWIHATPKPGAADRGEPDHGPNSGKHPKQNGGKHQKQNGGNRPMQYGPNDGGNQARPSHRPRPGSDGNSPINGLPAPGSPVYDRPHKGNGQGNENRPHKGDGQGNKHPKNGGQGAHPKNGQGQGTNNAHPKQNGYGQGNQPKPHTNKPHTLKPGGITIRPLTSATFHGVPTMVPIPKDKDPQHHNTPAATHTTHAPLINQTPKPTHVPHLQPDPKDEPKHKHKGDGKGDGKGKGEGVIGKKPSRRDVPDEVSEVYEVSEMPEAYGEQLSAFDEGITDTDGEGENDYYTGYSSYDADEETDKIYERALEASEADGGENKDFLATYWADKAWWEEYGRSLEGEDSE